MAATESTTSTLWASGRRPWAVSRPASLAISGASSGAQQDGRAANVTDRRTARVTSLLRVTAEPPTVPRGRYPRQPDPQPLGTDDRRTVLVGTAAWLVAGLVLVPFAGALFD